MGFLQGDGFKRPNKIIDREDDYRRRRLERMISPARNDAFAMGDKTPGAEVRTYGDILKATQLARERENTLKNIADKKKREEEEVALDRPTKASTGSAEVAAPADVRTSEKRRNRWDHSGGGETYARFLNYMLAQYVDNC